MTTPIVRRRLVPGLLCGLAVTVVVLCMAAPSAQGAPGRSPVEPPAGDASVADALDLDARSLYAPNLNAPGTMTLTWPISLYLPLVMRGWPPAAEIRALWVTRYDWTRFGHTATVTDVQTVVADAARAGFNTLLFQVRGAGDAYYTPGPEPWAARLTGTLGPSLGHDPGFDPLATMITLAHASGISVHAYVNVYPAWQAPPRHPNDPTQTYGTLTPTLGLTPAQWLNQLTYAPPKGLYALKSDWRVHDSPGHPMPIEWGEYVWASPTVITVQESILTVTAYLLDHYALDGLHLDLVRYPGPQYSYDPFTLAAFSQAAQISGTLVFTDWRGDFQRAQVSSLVARVYSQTLDDRTGAYTRLPLLSAAVWPDYDDGRTEYFQDSKVWLASGAIDAIAPMLYGSTITNTDQWKSAAQDFQAAARGRWVLPGIGVKPGARCESFADVAARIQTAREMGAAGQALFSYSALRDCADDQGRAYLDLLRQGPYATSASVPLPMWK